MDGVGGLKRLAEDQKPIFTGAKKTKLSDNTQPSRVLHVRGLPPSATEFGVAALAAPFGRVTNIMMLRQRSQALMELESEAASTACCNYYKVNPAMVSGQNVVLQHSRHSELVLSSTASTSASGDGRPSDGDGPNVLHVMIDNMIYPVTLDVLHTVFSKYGTVLRIVTFTKNGQYQALVELSDSASTSTAKMALDGQNIYDRCCTMRIDSSKLATLNINSNNERQRDYTKPDTSDNVANVRPVLNMPGASASSSISNLPGLHALPSGSMSALQSLMAATGGTGIPGLSAPGFPNAAAAGVMDHGSSPVILVSNLNEDRITLDQLFILFGVYGDVMRVKILFNKKNTALIQFTTGVQAQLAQRHLHRAVFLGQPIHVTISKHHTVALPKEEHDATLTRDFSDSVLHRFKQTGSHNLQNIYPPSASLHLSNIPADIGQEFLESLFQGTSPSIVAFKWLPSSRGDEEVRSDRRMALIQLPTVELAMEALVTCHNHKLSDKRYLRVSFAKNATVQ